MFKIFVIKNKPSEQRPHNPDVPSHAPNHRQLFAHVSLHDLQHVVVPQRGSRRRSRLLHFRPQASHCHRCQWALPLDPTTNNNQHHIFIINIFILFLYFSSFFYYNIQKHLKQNTNFDSYKFSLSLSFFLLIGF